MRTKKAGSSMWTSLAGLITENNSKRLWDKRRLARKIHNGQELDKASNLFLLLGQRSFSFLMIWLYIISISVLLSASEVKAQESTTLANIILDDETAGEIIAGDFEPFDGYRNYRTSALRSVAPGVSTFRFAPDLLMLGLASSASLGSPAGPQPETTSAEIMTRSAGFVECIMGRSIIGRRAPVPTPRRDHPTRRRRRGWRQQSRSVS